MGLCIQQEGKVSKLYKKLNGEVPMVYEWTGAAVAISALAAGSQYVEQKKQTKAAEGAAAEQAAILKQQEKDLAEKEKKREQRMGAARQGRRSLLYKEGTEKGVSTTLGG